MGSGVLIGDKRGEGTVLSESELTILQNALALWRSEDSEANVIAKALLGCSEKRQGGWFRIFLWELMDCTTGVLDETVGMLVALREDPVFLRDNENGEERMRSLQAFLKILQRGDWLADFLFAERIEKYAKKCPQPLELMRALAEHADYFESDVEDAKRMMREWPELFAGCEPAGQSSEAQEEDGVSPPQDVQEKKSQAERLRDILTGLCTGGSVTRDDIMQAVTLFAREDSEETDENADEAMSQGASASGD